MSLEVYFFGTQCILETMQDSDIAATDQQEAIYDLINCAICNDLE